MVTSGNNTAKSRSIRVKFDPLVDLYIRQLADKLGVSVEALVESCVKEKLVSCGITAWRNNIEKKIYPS